MATCVIIYKEMVGDQSHKGLRWATRGLSWSCDRWPETSVGDRQLAMPCRERLGIEFI